MRYQKLFISILAATVVFCSSFIPFHFFRDRSAQAVSFEKLRVGDIDKLIKTTLEKRGINLNELADHLVNYLEGGDSPLDALPDKRWKSLL